MTKLTVAGTLKTSAVHISFQYLINFNYAVIKIINGVAFAGKEMTLPRLALYESN
jgi:hypothetical protein